MAVPNPSPVPGKRILTLGIFRIGEGTEHTLRIFERAEMGIVTHWKDGRSKYCQGDDCPDSVHRIEPIWKSYAFSHRWDKAAKCWVPVVLELTEYLEARMRLEFEPGQTWTLSRQTRTKKDKRTPVDGKLFKRAEPFTDVRIENTLHQVRTLYHEPELRFSVPNPMPLPQIVDYIIGPSPFDMPPDPQPAQPRLSIEEEMRRRGIGPKGGGQ